LAWRRGGDWRSTQQHPAAALRRRPSSLLAHVGCVLLGRRRGGGAGWGRRKEVNDWGMGAEVGDAISRSRFSPHARRKMTTMKGTQTSTHAASRGWPHTRSGPVISDPSKEGASEKNIN
jgi:hypothetical protein